VQGLVLRTKSPTRYLITTSDTTMNLRSFDVLNGIVMICWLVFIVYWAISAIGVKKKAAGKTGRLRWLLTRCLLIVVVIAFFRLRAFVPLRHVAHALPFFQIQAVRIIGAAITVLGLAFAIWGRRHLGGNWSARATIQIGHELVTSGPYRFVRHPIYTGIWIMWFGAGLVNIIFLVIFALIALIFFSRIPKEEAFMMELFPNQYPAYRATTKALIPESGKRV
jgi:protein-S-isoprenylcysteine O-methyltransferase Ste14